MAPEQVWQTADARGSLRVRRRAHEMLPGQRASAARPPRQRDPERRSAGLRRRARGFAGRAHACHCLRRTPPSVSRPRDAFALESLGSGSAGVAASTGGASGGTPALAGGCAVATAVVSAFAGWRLRQSPPTEGSKLTSRSTNWTTPSITCLSSRPMKAGCARAAGGAPARRTRSDRTARHARCPTVVVARQSIGGTSTRAGCAHAD